MIPSEYATRLPAALPLPGPTGIPLSLAKFIKSETTKKYQENLTYYSNLKKTNQTRYLDEIVTDIERYRSLVDLLVIYNDKDFALAETKKFNDFRMDKLRITAAEVMKTSCE